MTQLIITAHMHEIIYLSLILNVTKLIWHMNQQLNHKVSKNQIFFFEKIKEASATAMKNT